MGRRHQHLRPVPGMAAAVLRTVCSDQLPAYQRDSPSLAIGVFLAEIGAVGTGATMASQVRGRGRPARGEGYQCGLGWMGVWEEFT